MEAPLPALAELREKWAAGITGEPGDVLATFEAALAKDVGNALERQTARKG
jgi:hypothetical protein